MRAIGIETATTIASVGLIDGDRILAAHTLPTGGSHARHLLSLIDGALRSAEIGIEDVDLLAVSIGPGSFTGLRIGLSTAKGLALATGRPIVGVPTMEAYAWSAGPRTGLICPVLDARKGEVYGAAYRRTSGTLECVIPAAALVPAAFAALLHGPCILIGDGTDAYAAVWRRELGERAQLIPFGDLAPSGAVVAQLGVARLHRLGPDDLAGLEPQYCRRSEAEVTHARRRGAPVRVPSSQEVHQN